MALWGVVDATPFSIFIVTFILKITRGVGWLVPKWGNA